MNVGDTVWLRHLDGQHVSDRGGSPVPFEIAEVDTPPAAGTWYRLSTSHTTAQDIYGGWYTRRRLTPDPINHLKESSS
ncbi:hypothetical protein AB0I10_12580 [Streptomyces sp. NPDC050636]|uniref:hypothetical protein n=1 Tax=Streptomyces sp. NPDC050636 TaxID=3154510 RepID=UPI003424FE15